MQPNGRVHTVEFASNGISLITADGDVSIIYEDVNPDSIDALVTAMENNVGTADLLGACMMVEGPLRLQTSLAFGGDDGKTVFVGSLAMDRLATFKAPFVVAHGGF